MKVLIICSGNFPNDHEKSFSIYQAFIDDQINAVSIYTNDIDVYLIKGKGILGYLRNLRPLRKYIKEKKVDILHAHSGLSGMLAALIRNKPLIVTYHGSDINESKGNFLSVFPILRANWNIFVSKNLYNKTIIKPKNRYNVIPCGVDFDLFKPMDREDVRTKMGIKREEKIILFSSSFDNRVKNYPLAKQAIESLNEKVRFIEIKNRTRQEVALMLNAADLLLLTSFSEGSPQIIKEAMACNCPIVATDIGDIKEVITDTKGCYIASFNTQDIAIKINKALTFGNRTNGREKIQHFDNRLIASNIFDIYKKVYKSYYGKE